MNNLKLADDIYDISEFYNYVNHSQINLYVI